MRVSDAALDRETILLLLEELGKDLDRRGIRGEMFVVGGAPMALAYNSRRSTRDVDAVFEPKTTLYDTAATVGERHGLPPGWLNDSVEGLLPGPDPSPRELVEVPGLRVSVASAGYLLALKVAAARVDRDADDIEILAAACGLRSARQVLDHTQRVFGNDRVMLPKVQYLVEELFPE